MAYIDYEITEQRFESIRNRIAFILADELSEQSIITGNTLFDAIVWIERFIPFDKIELPAINVYFKNVNYDENTPITSKGTNFYNIDVIVSGKDSDTSGGDKIAVLKLQKLLGVLRFILENPNYLTLDFSENFIYTTKVSDINISQPSSNQDGTHTVSGQLTFEVTAEELNGDIQPIAGEIYTSQQKIGTSEKGYFIQINN